MAQIPQSEVTYAPDQAEAEQGQVILEEKNKKRVRYWWEEGYVPGNEKDSDDEKSESGSETKATECEKQPDINALPSVDGEDSDYEVVVPGDAKGGRLVRWGGLHGRLCLADGDLALEDGECESDKSQKALAPLQDYLDELLIPTGEPTEVQAQTGAESLPALENMPPAAAETMAIVLYQTPASRVKPWSFCTITDSMSSKVDQAEVQQVFAIEDAKRNNRLYSEEMQALSQVAIGNYFLRQQQGFEAVQKAKEDEAIRRRQVKEGSKERLPGTKHPLAVSQAWQEHQQVEAASFQKPRKTLLPGSLAGGSSSSSSRMPKETMRKEPGPKPGRQKEVHQDAFDDSDFEPKFKIPEMPLSRRCYRPSRFDEAS